MNIFALDYNPNLAAQYHNDKHVVKMVLETAQLICTTVTTVTGKETAYKPTHVNHPCALWARESKENFSWLCDLGVCLSAEYVTRFGREHRSTSVILTYYMSSIPLPEKGLTKFAQAMPEAFQQLNPVAAYREYYLNAKRHLAKWTNRGAPPWWQ